MPSSRRKPKVKPATEVAAAEPLPIAWLLAGLLVLATLALYWPALQHGFVNYDDDRYVTANAQVQSGLTLANLGWALANPVADNWHPVTVWSHMLVCQLCGVNPWGHHLANVLLHAANAGLVFLWLRRLTGAVWKSLAVAALFALHPLRVESVAWVAERKDVLSGFFGLLALIGYTIYAQAQIAKGPGRLFAFSRAYWLALVALVLGLMSKPMLVTWPLVLLLLDYWPLGRAKPGCVGRLLLEKIPFFAVAAAAGIVTWLVQQRGAATEMIQNLSFAARGENALISYCRYLGKIFWPTDLAVLYPYPGNWPMLDVLLAGGFLAGLTILLIWRRRRQPFMLFGWLWFLGTLIPVIGLVQVGLQSMADRYTYLPSLGVLLAVVWGAGALTPSGRRWTLLWAAAGGTAVAVCMVLTWKQLQYWQDGETLFRHTLAVTPNNYVAHYNLGVALDEQNRGAEAMHEYQAALQIQTNYARAHVNLGLDWDKLGEADEAMNEYQQAVRLAPDNVYARNNLGIAFFNKGRNDEAIQQFQEAVKLAPDNAGVHNSLGAALYTEGKTDEAIHEFQAALRLAPNYAEAHFNLGCLLEKRGQNDEAINQYQEAIRIKPGYLEAQERLGGILNAQDKSK
jgi:Flp pilus assembly protein TadD